ncbi:MAG TPA: SDR family oxidoreductase [Actinomycetota bacterium]|jgi:NAD(P)-dependent dehydrogenase (short-subunit alcohol dehydrogenase family)
MGAIVITGASTGIGRACALHLDANGHRVFAGVRKDADGEDLAQRARGNLTPVIIDVTDQSSIAAAAKVVDEAVGSDGLQGLVNNAGIAVSGPLEYLPIDDLRKQLEVNVIGQIAVTQAFLPAIRRGRGRVVNIGSVAGRSPSAPLIGPYAASKMAMEALTDSLRLELARWDVKVAIVEPGAIATPIWDKSGPDFDNLTDAMPDEGRQRYGKLIETGRKIAAAQNKRGIPPEKVAKAVEHALTSPRPRTRYLVGTDAQVRARVEGFIPDKLRDKIVARIVKDRD